MQRRIITLVFLLLWPALVYSANDQITITNYYPSPQGSYKEIYLKPHPRGTCDSSKIGTIVYDSSEASVNKLKVCTDTGWQFVNSSSGSLDCKTFYAWSPDRYNGSCSCVAPYNKMVSGGCFFSGQTGGASYPGPTTSLIDNSSYPDTSTNTWYCSDNTNHADLWIVFVRCCK